MINGDLKLPEVVYIVLFDLASRSRIPKLISPVGVDQENAPVLSICQYGLSGLDMAFLLGVYG